MNYINNEYNIDLASNETIGYSVDNDTWCGWYSWTPEFYVYNDGQRTGLSFCSFKEGIPYFHNLSTELTYMNYFGVQTDQVIRVVINEGSETEKRFQAIAIDTKDLTNQISGIKYGANDVLTSDNFESFIPIEAFEFRENWYFSVFYRSTSLGGTLQTGQQLRGTWCEVGLVRDQDEEIQPLYNQVAKIVGFYMTSEKSIK